MDDPNISSIDPILHQTPSMLSTGQFGDSLQFNSTTTTTNSNSSKPQPITISRLSQSNITKALLSYDQNDDHHAPSDSDKYTEYTEEMPIAPSHKDITPFNSKKNDYDRENMAYLLSDEDEDDHERIDERLPIAPPPPFSSLTSSFTIHDLQDDQTIPPPPLTPPPPPYHYSTTGEIDPSATSPLQQSVIQRIQTKKAAHRVL